MTPQALGLSHTLVAIGSVLCILGFVLMCIPRPREFSIWVGIGIWVAGFTLAVTGDLLS